MLRLDFNLVWNIVNVIVLYLLLKHFLIKPVMDIMNKRQAMVDQSITNARASESQASELKSQYEEKLAASANADQEKAMREAEAQIAGLVLAAAAKVVQGEMDDRKNQALYDQYIAEAGDSHDAGSK